MIVISFGRRGMRVQVRVADWHSTFVLIDDEIGALVLSLISHWAVQSERSYVRTCSDTVISGTVETYQGKTDKGNVVVVVLRKKLRLVL